MPSDYWEDPTTARLPRFRGDAPATKEARMPPMLSDTLKHQGEPYAYCETSAAYFWHIRKLDERGLKPGGIGGEPAMTLCNQRAAWDIDVRIAPFDLTACRKCREEYLKREARRG